MALALRPLLSESSMKSKNGSHALAEGLRVGSVNGGESGDTALAGFDSDSVESGDASLAGFDSRGGKSGDVSLAGFAGCRRPHTPGGRTVTPAAFRYAADVSRRIPVS